ncbi:hypothetical protein [Rhodopseudomonas palustris]|uniref:hypothetical protein n=1 Tax=Rhodopseudomonas palustris TaxID=1076 RepID=UPI0005A2EDEF
MAWDADAMRPIGGEMYCERLAARSRRETRPAITTIILIMIAIKIVIDVLARRRSAAVSDPS